MRFVDLSATIEPSPPEVPAVQRAEIRPRPTPRGPPRSRRCSTSPEPPPGRRGLGGRGVHEAGHAQLTHVDAPWHYNSVIQGKRAATIDELPLEWFFADGVVLDMTGKADGEKVGWATWSPHSSAIGHDLKPLDIVLVRTGRDAFYGQPDYVWRGCAVTAEATHWLYERGVRVMGIDAWGWDGPLDRQAKEALARREPGVFWAAHQCDLPYSQIERLVNLGALPPTGFMVSCFPLRIVGGSAAPARVVAILDD